MTYFRKWWLWLSCMFSKDMKGQRVKNKTLGLFFDPLKCANILFCVWSFSIKHIIYFIHNQSVCHMHNQSWPNLEQMMKTVTTDTSRRTKTRTKIDGDKRTRRPSRSDGTPSRSDEKRTLTYRWYIRGLFFSFLMLSPASNRLQKGYDDLQSIVPTCQQQSEFAVGAQKISKATVLQKSEMRRFFQITLLIHRRRKADGIPFCSPPRSHWLHPLSPQRKEEAGGGGFSATEGSDGAEDHENVSWLVL